MSERDELADDFARDVWWVGAVSNYTANRVSEGLRERGYRKHERVTTADRLAALPEGTLFRSGDRLGRLWAHSASALDGGHVWADKHDALPLEVLA